MSRSDGLWVPDTPEFLADQDAVELLFVKSLREPEPMPTPQISPTLQPFGSDKPSISQLAAALVKARGRIKAISKDSTNPHFKSKYTSLDAIIGEVTTPLNEEGLVLLQGVVAPDRDEHGKLTAFTVRTTLLHVSGESLDRDVVMPVAKSDPQGAGAALTYGRRYGISALLGLATDEDDDGNSASRGAKQQRSERRPPPDSKQKHTGPNAQLMPIGNHKGQALGSLDNATLTGARTWMVDNRPTQYATAIEAIESVLEERRLAAENEAVYSPPPSRSLIGSGSPDQDR